MTVATAVLWILPARYSLEILATAWFGQSYRSNIPHISADTRSSLLLLEGFTGMPTVYAFG